MHRRSRLGQYNWLTGKLGQIFCDIGISRQSIEKNPPRYGMARIVMCQKGRQNSLRRMVTRVLRELRTIAKMPPAAHHRQIDAEHAIFDNNSDNIGIFTTRALDKLLVPHPP